MVISVEVYIHVHYELLTVVQASLNVMHTIHKIKINYWRKLSVMDPGFLEGDEGKGRGERRENYYRWISK